MRNVFFVCLFCLFSNCDYGQKKQVFNSKEGETEDLIKIKDSLVFNEENEIIGISHFENEIKDGFSLIFDEKTNNPKYLVEYNQGKRDKILIEFSNEGKMKSFRTADFNNNSQKMKFHENGTIKEIGNTIRGKAQGIWYYFDEDGKLVKKVLYKEGQIVENSN